MVSNKPFSLLKVFVLAFVFFCFTEYVQAQADLMVTMLSLSKTTAAAGETVQVQYRIQNGGSATASNFKLRLYFSSNSTITIADAYLGHERTIASLAAGASSTTYTATITIPGSASIGSRYIGAIVDYNNQVTESNESNNSRAAVITIIDMPDLIVSLLTIDKASAAPGDMVQVQYRIQNTGNATASNFKLRLYLSLNSTITISDTYLNHERTFATLDAGTSSSTYTANVRIPGSTADGVLYIGGIVDYNNQVVEINENNNTEKAAVNICSGFAELSEIIGDTAVCENSTKTFSISVVSGAFSYTWDIPKGWIGRSTSNSITFSNISIEGTIYVVANNICGNSSPAKSLYVKTVVMPNPVITIEGNLLHSNATEGNQWYKGDDPIEGSTNLDYTAIESGNYYVIVTNDCGTALSNTIDYISTAIETVDKNRSITIYPNPAVNSVQIVIDDDKLLSGKVFLINSNGVIVKQDLINSTTLTFDVSNLSKGIYFVKAVSVKAVSTEKLILK